MVAKGENPSLLSEYVEPFGLSILVLLTYTLSDQSIISLSLDSKNWLYHMPSSSGPASGGIEDSYPLRLSMASGGIAPCLAARTSS